MPEHVLDVGVTACCGVEGEGGEGETFCDRERPIERLSWAGSVSESTNQSAGFHTAEEEGAWLGCCSRGEAALG